jgi:hypothetical protein
MSAPPLYSPESNPARFEQLVNAIARTQKILVLCGDSATGESGLPVSFASSTILMYNLTRKALSQSIDHSVEIILGAQKRRTPLRTLLRDCSPATTPADDLDPRLLANLNRAMAARRVAARSVPASCFHSFLARLCESGKLLGILTTSFDGLEAHGDPVLEAKTTMLHGDNRVLRCCRRGCSTESQADTAKLDGKLLDPFASGDTSDELGHLCGACFKKCEWRCAV